MVMESRIFRTGIGAAALVLMLAGCATQQQRVEAREDMLAAAGFEVHPADNLARKAMLQKLPPHRFVVRDVHGSFIYMYSDPLVCGCLYVGTQKAYNTYKQEIFQQHLADEQQMTAQIYADPAWSFGGWGGPWGPGFGPGFGGPGF
ncbi:hypothetical protein [Paraburkholderia tropica]|uniref:hypothetical protein n=1 Tax=Paraburkholderia tropica TaxID=92647 RepID=UPI002AB310B8|nr:hypothetical protein [Paraburkholderia tropica]